MALELHNALGLLTVLILFLSLFFFFISPYFTRLIHKKYPRIPLMDVRSCPICGMKVVPEKSTKNIFLFPYLFKSLRHYEKYHSDIAMYARKARIIASLSINSAIFGITLGLTLQSLDVVAVKVSLEEYILQFIVSFFGGLIFFWLLIAIFLYKILAKEKL